MLRQNNDFGYNGLNDNVAIDVYNSIKVMLFKIFQISLEEIFGEKL